MTVRVAVVTGADRGIGRASISGDDMNVTAGVVMFEEWTCS